MMELALLDEVHLGFFFKFITERIKAVIKAWREATKY